MKLLIVDDERSTRETVKMLVDWKQYGFDEILEAGNGRQALEMVRREVPALIITDMKMPVMDGTLFLEALDYNSPDTIVISGYSDFAYTKSAIRSNVLDYLLKPIKPQELETAV